MDLIATRKNTKMPSNALLNRGDLFDIVLIQIKGCSAHGPTRGDCVRLREVKRFYRAKHVVQFQWRKGKSSTFFLWGETSSGSRRQARSCFSETGEGWVAFESYNACNF